MRTSTGATTDRRCRFAGDRRITFVTSIPRDPDLTARLPHRGCDVVPAATAPYRLRAREPQALRGTPAGLPQDGGVLPDADPCPTPRRPGRPRPCANWSGPGASGGARRGSALDWEQWWDTARADPVLAGPSEERFVIYGSHADGDELPPAWHAAALREAGFGEAREVWRSVSDAIVLGLK